MQCVRRDEAKKHRPNVLKTFLAQRQLPSYEISSWEKGLVLITSIYKIKTSAMENFLKVMKKKQISS